MPVRGNNMWNSPNTGRSQHGQGREGKGRKAIVVGVLSEWDLGFKWKMQEGSRSCRTSEDVREFT